MIKATTDCYRLRYIVPFGFDTDAEAFDDRCHRISREADWDAADVEAGEQDIYQYITNAFSWDEKKNNIGCAFSYQKSSGKSKPLVTFEEKNSQQPTKFSIAQAGMFLFRSGVGFFWYEVEFDSKTIKADTLIKLQNQFKELNRNDNRQAYMVTEAGTATISQILLCTELPATPITLSEEASVAEPSTVVSSIEENYIPCKLLRPIPGAAPEVSAGYLDKEQLQQILPDVERCCDFEAVISDNIHLKFRRRYIFVLGKWIADIIHDILPDVCFYPDRKACTSAMEMNFPTTANSQMVTRVPDKALLFNYVVLHIEENPEDTLVSAAYYLTNGYKESYLPQADFVTKMYCPFHNAYWYASKEGCGYYIREESVNSSFFKSNMKEKVINDYFLLYILALQQSYTMLHYAIKIQSELSADMADYQGNSSAHATALSTIITDINVFLMKNVFASVSHVQHQNGFYSYLQECLSVESDIQNITEGLSSLEELERMREEKKEDEENANNEKRLEWCLSLLSLLAVFSAFADAKAMLEAFVTIFTNLSTFNKVVLGVYIFILIFIVVILIRLFCNSRKRKKR